jgi:hypothetical protein
MEINIILKNADFTEIKEKCRGRLIKIFSQGVETKQVYHLSMENFNKSSQNSAVKYTTTMPEA